MLETKAYSIKWWNENVEGKPLAYTHIANEYKTLLKENETGKIFAYDISQNGKNLFIICTETKDY